MIPTRIAVTGLIAAAALGACSAKTEERRAQADAKAAGFVPPSVTSRVDWGTQQERRFTRRDRDGDGILRGAELPRDNARLMALDRNRNGEITASEFGEGQMARFDQMDLNRDGTLTSDERVEARRGS